MDGNKSVTDVNMRVGRTVLPGVLCIPKAASAVILFAHGSGSGRSSARNKAVAEQLNKAGLATLLFDLLTIEEEHEKTGPATFDIALLAERLIAATAWIIQHEPTRVFRIGYFGASTGAAAALTAAAELPRSIGAIVSRGGRPDLAANALPKVQSPTLLIVGDNDQPTLELNRAALLQLKCVKHLETIAGATHLFEEPGALKIVAELATHWFESHLIWPEQVAGSTAS